MGLYNFIIFLKLLFISLTPSSILLIEGHTELRNRQSLIHLFVSEEVLFFWVVNQHLLCLHKLIILILLSLFSNLGLDFNASCNFRLHIIVSGGTASDGSQLIGPNLDDIYRFLDNCSLLKLLDIIFSNALLVSELLYLKFEFFLGKLLLLSLLIRV